MRIAAIASWPRRRASEPKFSDKKSGETITRAATFLAIGSALVPGMNRSSRNSRVCDAGPSMQPPTAANCAVRPNFFSDETLPASMLWQIRSPVVKEMQTAAMEREYARAVSIWTIEAIFLRGPDFHRIGTVHVRVSRFLEAPNEFSTIDPFA